MFKANAFDSAFDSYTLIKLDYEAPSKLNAFDKTDYSALDAHSLFDDPMLYSGMNEDAMMMAFGMQPLHTTGLYQ